MLGSIVGDIRNDRTLHLVSTLDTSLLRQGSERLVRPACCLGPLSVPSVVYTSPATLQHTRITTRLIDSGPPPTASIAPAPAVTGSYVNASNSGCSRLQRSTIAQQPLVDVGSDVP